MNQSYRNARLTDVPRIMTIINAAVERMLREGKQQWDENYPSVTHIIEDIDRGIARVLLDGDTIAAYGAVVPTGEPAYDNITDGDWLTEDTPYVTVHRLAVAPDMQGRGLAVRFLDITCDMAARQGFRSMRIDTNHDNYRMLRLLQNNGFERCGIVSYGPKGDRIAFERLI
ncbi:MAG: GNAT family N-acetyltransferase [Muribaculaceae bacterium]|nr:GNAT family N-acetyltransferase [Muribaculaceae bacterium]